MNAELITAAEYLDLENRALRHVPSSSELKRIQADLARMPRTQERLVFEFLTIADHALERGESPEDPVLLAIRMSASVRSEDVPSYLASIEKIALRCFEIMGQRHDSRFTLTLAGALASLRRVGAARFRLVLQTLRQSCGTSTADPRYELLAMAELTDSERREALRRLMHLAVSQNTGLTSLAKN